MSVREAYPEAITKTGDQRKRFESLKRDMDSWRAHWQEIAEYMMPRRGRYLLGESVTESNDGKKKNDKIINGSASDALRTIAAGLQGGLTSPSRPWFAFKLQDTTLMEYTPVRVWLATVRDILLHIMTKSNFYDSVHGLYKEVAAFGTNAMLTEEDMTTSIRCRPMTIGEFYIALDNQFRPSVLYRRFAMTAEQLVKEFGKDAVSDSVWSLFTGSSKDTRVNIIHAIEPNSEYNPLKLDAKGMAYTSMYYEENQDPDLVLRIKGYKTIPFVAPRWFVNGTDTYGDSPGMEALGDVKMLQKMEEKKLKALDKSVDPPMNAPASMKGKGGTIVSGGVNYIDTSAGQQGFTPAYMVNPNFQNMAFEIDRVEKRIAKFFYNDLFLAILNNERTMTATEVAKKWEEKLIVLGPTLERLQSELLGPLIERVYNIANDQGLIPPPPEELAGQDVKIEYISLLAQAQKLVGIDSIEKTLMFAGNIANFIPSILDKIDADEALDQYAEMVGTPPKVIRSDDEVQQIRDMKAQQQQQQQQAMAQQAVIENAKTMADTKMGEGNALDSYMAASKGQ